MSNIVNLHGEPIDPPAIGDPNLDLIVELESLLGRARAGEIQAVAWAYSTQDGTVGTGWRGAKGTRHFISTALLILQHRYSEALRK